MKSRIAALVIAGAALFGCNAEPQAAGVAAATPEEAAPADAASTLPRIPLQIVSGGRTHSFNVEVAQTPEEQAQGLMYRKRVGPDEGMLFPFQPPREASFWMKNTLIPLDMIFVATDGTIESIAVNTTPLSEASTTSRGVVAAVLELAGGRSRELGLKEGDRVVWTGGPQP